MSWIGNLGIRQKLWCIAFPALFFIIVIGTIGYLGLSSSSKTIDEIYQEVYLPTTYIEEMNVLNDELRSNMLELMITTDPEKNKLLISHIDDIKKEMNDKIALYEKSTIESEEAILLKSLKEKILSSLSVTNDIVILAGANLNVQAYDLYLEKGGPVQDEIEMILESMAKYNLESGKNMVDHSQSVVEATGKRLLAIIMASCLLGFAVVRIVAKSVVPQLKEMAAYLEKVADGDLSLETLKAAKKSEIYHDEVGKLALSILKMRENLSRLITNVSDSASTIAASAQQLSANAGESSKGIDEIANSVTTIASNTDEQLRTVTRSSGIVKNISMNIDETVTNTTETGVAAKGALDATARGEAAINMAKEQMNHIEKTVVGLEDVINNLNASSGQIGQIAGAISAIADQTNLLALNAAIEAARAGEQGRGFSVVADEVRKLAEQSQGSTKEITDLIIQIQRYTNNAVSAMKDGSEQVRIGLDVVNRAGVAFDHVATQVSGMEAMIALVSKDANSIADGNEILVETMSQVDVITNSVAEQTQNISANIEEQSAAMVEIAGASENLAEIASNLQMEISKFKL